LIKVIKLKLYNKTNSCYTHFLIDDEVVDIKLHFDIVLKHKLSKNQILSKKEFEELIFDNNLLYAKNMAYTYATYKMRTEKEVIEKLRRKDYNETIIERCLEFLKEFKLLNDYNYAQLFAKEKAKSKLWGKYRIKTELLKKGVKSNIIEDAIYNSFPEEENYNIALESAKKKYRQIKYKKDPIKIKMSLSSYLQRNGFDFETINKVLEEIIE